MSKLPAMSASSGHYLPPEITEAILPFLPAKSLGRFKSVSKRWNSLISDPKFIKTHLLHHQTTKLIMVSYTNSPYSIDTKELLNRSDGDDIPATAKEVSFGSPPIQLEDILGSCNGLVLANDINDTLFLLNPTTQELWKVPLSPFALPVRVSVVTYGFGYDSSTDDYKVVSLSFWDPYSDHDDDMHLSVYSLGNNSWKNLPNSHYHISYGGVLLNQNLHWLASTRGCSLTTIIAFSLANEGFSEVKLPENEKFVGYYDLAVLGGKLGLLLGAGMDNELWVMEEYGLAESWTRLCTHGLRPLCLVEGSNRDIVSEDLGEVVVHNMDEGRRRNVRILGGGPSRFKCHIGGVYVETLESTKRVMTPP